MTKRNAWSLELIHEWSTAQKAAYNREYYRKNKDRWKDGYSKVGVVTPREKWQLDVARRRHELGDNSDLHDRAAERYYAAQYGRENAGELMRRENELAKSKRRIAGYYHDKGARDQSRKYEDEAKVHESNASSYADQVKDHMKRERAAEGDMMMYNQIGNLKNYNTGRAPQATMKTQSKTKLAINRVKRSATKAAEVIGSKAHSAGKAFIDNWKAGWG